MKYQFILPTVLYFVECQIAGTRHTFTLSSAKSRALGKALWFLPYPAAHLLTHTHPHTHAHRVALPDRPPRRRTATPPPVPSDRPPSPSRHPPQPGHHPPLSGGRPPPSCATGGGPHHPPPLPSPAPAPRKREPAPLPSRLDESIRIWP